MSWAILNYRAILKYCYQAWIWLHGSTSKFLFSTIYPILYNISKILQILCLTYIHYTPILLRAGSHVNCCILTKPQKTPKAVSKQSKVLRAQIAVNELEFKLLCSSK